MCKFKFILPPFFAVRLCSISYLLTCSIQRALTIWSAPAIHHPPAAHTHTNHCLYARWRSKVFAQKCRMNASNNNSNSEREFSVWHFRQIAIVFPFPREKFRSFDFAMQKMFAPYAAAAATTTVAVVCFCAWMWQWRRFAASALSSGCLWRKCFLFSFFCLLVLENACVFTMWLKWHFRVRYFLSMVLGWNAKNPIYVKCFPRSRHVCVVVH